MDDPPPKSESLGSISLVTQILCFAIISPLIGLRLFARVKLHHPFGVEDGKYFFFFSILGDLCLWIYVANNIGDSNMLYCMGNILPFCQMSSINSNDVITNTFQ